jgi:hypothetical protein
VGRHHTIDAQSLFPNHPTSRGRSAYFHAGTHCGLKKDRVKSLAVRLNSEPWAIQILAIGLEEAMSVALPPDATVAVKPCRQAENRLDTRV